MNTVKKIGFFWLGLLFLACGSGPAPEPSAVPAPVVAPAPVAAQEPAITPDELDAAIRETSDYFNKQLSKESKLVILNIQSEYPALSEYVIDELIANTVNDRVFSVVDRQQLNTIRAELDFQMSGEVDDSTAQALGRLAGAQIIVSGAVSRIGYLYRLRVRALSVESARIEGQFNRNIPDGPTIAALAKSRATGYGGSDYAGTTAAAKPAAQAAQAPSGQTAIPVPAPAPASAPAAAPAPVPVTPPAPATPAAPVAAPAYKIGDKGPAGGLIFYANGVAQADTVPPPVTREYQIGEVGPSNGLVFYANGLAQADTVPPPVNREYHAGETGPAGGLVFYPVTLVKTAPPPVTREYQVGDTGPAGGVIFYVNPQAGEWKYLEAAPAGTEITAIWTPVGRAAFVNNDNVAVGKGLDNTKAIVNHFTQIGGGFGSAAWECNDLVVNGFDDWFLPSRDELSYMYGNLHRKGLGGFSSNWYWSSSSYYYGTSDNANTVNFQDGAQGGDRQHNKHRVRAVRQF
ncbi:MAG: DUF1566 domain-containing protein [Treponema sp.]|nr:DUF1566 domain-containing protein [Treponema sp.]